MSWSRLYYGPVVNPKSLTEFDAFTQCLIAVGPTGLIEWMEDDVPATSLQDIMAKHGCTSSELIDLRYGQFLVPGFIDTHTHAPQFPNIGSGGEYELLEWLEKLTFPEESKFADTDYARKAYQRVVNQVINCGTTTCCYYGTLHVEATKALADIVHAAGQRAFVGKCNMDRNSPDYYCEESHELSLQHTREFILHTSKYESAIPDTDTPALIQPILTPRFAISCTGSLLESLGTLASESPGLRVQTHISENKSEIEFTKALFPDCSSYAAVYDKYGLLKNNTILAHCVHLELAEIELIKARGAGISHCPTSNFNLNSGIAPIGHLLDQGIKIGLGTDVSGGFSHSIITAIQHASIASKAIAFQNTNEERSADKHQYRPLNLPTLLHLATLGGAQVCSIDDVVGSFAPGKAFDALLVDLRPTPKSYGLRRDTSDTTLSPERVEEFLEEFFFTGDDRNIRNVFVQGRCIGGIDSTP